MIILESSTLLGESSMEITSFHDRLSWARRHHARITQRKLAERMKTEFQVSVGSNYISELELDKGKKPTFEVVRAMAGVLGVSLDWLANFSDEMLLSRNKDGGAEYFSPEADEVAQLIDKLRPEQRAAIAALARGMVAPTERQRDEAAMWDMLESVQRDLGMDARKKVEKILRALGLLRDSDT